MTRIFYAGDSTCAQNNITTFPQTGIGQGLELYIKKEIKIHNHAVNGRSTKSFIEQGRLAVIEQQVLAGDFLFIQFGHNDDDTKSGNTMYNRMVPLGTPDANGIYPVTPGEKVPTTHNIKDIAYITFHHLSWFDMQDNSWYANNKDAIEGAQFYINLDGVSATEIKVKCIPIGYNWQDRTKNRYVTLEYTKTTD